MSTLAWLLVAWLAFNGVAQVWWIGRRREPKTAGEAIFAMGEVALAIWAVVELAT